VERGKGEGGSPGFAGRLNTRENLPSPLFAKEG